MRVIAWSAAGGPRRGRGQAISHYQVAYSIMKTAPQDGCNLLLVGKDLLRDVVDHYGTFEVGHGWISAVLLADESAPRFRVHGFCLRPRIPEVDAARRSPVLGEHVGLPKQAFDASIRWRGTQEEVAGFLARDRLRQREGRKDGNHLHLVKLARRARDGALLTGD